MKPGRGNVEIRIVALESGAKATGGKVKDGESRGGPENAADSDGRKAVGRAEVNPRLLMS